MDATQFTLNNPFQSSADRILQERQERAEYQKKILRFGVSYLDDALGGIGLTDLILLTAKSGAGKTELATQIALENIKRGSRVHFFALEAENNEIERRIKFKRLSDAFYMQKNWKSYGQVPNFLDWYSGRNQMLDQFEPEIDEILKEELKFLHTRYRATDFTAQDFVKESALIKDETDLIIVDHLHYFDSEESNENKAFKEIIKTIRDTALAIRKPVLALAQLRKSDRKAKTLVPDMEDIHGSSDLPKIATKMISLAPAKDQQQHQPWLFPTYIRAAKCRLDGSRTYAVGLAAFNARINAYDKKYFIGKLSITEDEFIEIPYNEWPHWAVARNE